MDCAPRRPAGGMPREARGGFEPLAVANLRGGAPGTRAPPGSEFFHFHAVFGRKNRLAHPLWELAPPPPGENPGSATVWDI